MRAPSGPPFHHLPSRAKRARVTDPADEKRELRAAMRARRARIAPAEAAAAALQVCGRLRAACAPADDGPVAGYWPMGDEFDVRPTLEAFAAAGRRCVLPVVVGRGRPLIFRRWAPGDALVSGGYGTSIPAADREEIRPALLLVPLLAFDRRGFRLGYGGGYYDMTIAALRRDDGVRAIGVAFAAQEVEAVPVESFDQRLDAIATEAELMSFDTVSA
jgi:5-formyltetrahydrofolate cyclo-ligase